MEATAVRAKALRFATPLLGAAGARAALAMLLDGDGGLRPGGMLLAPNAA